MRYLHYFAHLCLILCLTPRFLTAQTPTPGQNVNMVSGTQWPGGDPFLQRQNEPSIAISTRNPLHLLAGANDYRTVDLNPVDELPINSLAGDAWMGVFKSFDGGQRWQSTLLPGFPQDQSQFGAVSPMKGFGAASDPVVRAGTNGMFYYSSIALNRGSNLGGIFISRLIDLNNKENGDAAQSGSAGPTSLYPNPTTDPIRYINTVEVDSGTAGQFIDKPWMAVDIPRSGSGTCNIQAPQDNGKTATQSFPAGNVYLAYAMFVGGQINVRSKINFARSTDCGATWSKPIMISQTYKINQGTSIAVDPETGFVYVAWRVFNSGNDSDDIVVTKSVDGGNTFSKALSVRSLLPYSAAAPTQASFLDEGTTGTAFRTQSMPSIAVDDSGSSGVSGRVYITWAERDPASSGDARVMISTSSDGLTWPPPTKVDPGPIKDDLGNTFFRGHQLMPAITFIQGKLMILYYDVRLDHTVGFFDLPQPSIPDSQGKFFLEHRPRVPGDPDSSIFTSFIDDAGLTVRRHTVDVTVAQSNGGPNPSFTYSRVSRYDFGLPAPEGNGDEFEQLKYNPPNLPLFAQGTVPFIGDYIDIAGQMFVPLAGGGWTYNNPLPATVAGVPAPKPKITSATHYATWTTNQDVIAPLDGDWTNYSAVPLPGQSNSIFDGKTQLLCQPGHEGDRNQNIYSSRITQGLLVSSPQNSKPLLDANLNPIQRAFAVLVQNSTDLPKYFQLSIPNQPAGTFMVPGSSGFITSGYASFVQALPNQQPWSKTATLPAPVIYAYAAVGPHSGVARSVFVLSSVSAASVTVNVNETDQFGTVIPGALSSFIVLNADPSAVAALALPDLSTNDPNLAEIYDPNIITPNIITPNIITPNIITPNIITPNIITPNIITPNIITPSAKNNPPQNTNPANPNIITPNIITPNIITNNLSDAAYTITNQGNTNAAYQVKLVGGSKTPLQVAVAQVYTTPTSFQCQLIPQVQNVTLTNIATPKFTDPSQLGAPNIITADPSETSINLAPGDSAVIILRAPVDRAAMQEIVTQVAPVVVPQAVNTNSTATTPTFAAPLFITTAALPDGTAGRPYGPSPPAGIELFPGVQLTSIGTKAPRWSVASANLPAGLALSPTGVLSGRPTASNLPGTVVSFQVQDGSSGAIATRALTIRIADPLAISTQALPTAFRGTAFTQALTSVGGLAPILWTKTSATLPELTIRPDGLLTGTPLTAGEFDIAVVATDSANPAQAVSQTMKLVVQNPPNALVFGSQPSSGHSGQTIAPAIAVQLTDASNGVLPGIRVSIAIGSTACSTAALSGTVSRTTDATGTATFDDLSISRGGYGFTLVASVSGGVSATSRTFDSYGFCATGQMPSGRDAHTSTTLADGRVLIAGGTSDGSALIYSPVTHTFSPTGTMTAVRYYHTATRLNDGRVLLVGGSTDDVSFTGTTLASTEIFDPATGSFTASGSMANPRFDHTATMLLDGRVLITGGNHSFANPDAPNGRSEETWASAEIYNSGDFSPTAPMNHPRTQHIATALPDGTVLIAGGFSFSQAEVFDPAGNTGSGSFISTADGLTSPRVTAAGAFLGSKVLFFGGWDGQQSLQTTDIYDVGNALFASGPVMTRHRHFHQATVLRGGNVLVSGGFSNPIDDGAFFGAVASAELYLAATNSFTRTGDMVTGHRRHQANVLPDGTVLITGDGNPNAELYFPPPAVSESAAIASMRRLQAAQQQYFIATNTFAANNAQLAPYVGAMLGCAAAPCVSGGYGFSVIGDPPTLIGDPPLNAVSGYVPTASGSGVRSFCSTVSSKAACLALPPVG